MPELPRLIAVDPAAQPVAITLSEDKTTIGRAVSNTVCLPDDESVSRFHSAIHRRLGLFWLEDLDSTNGSFLAMPGSAVTRLMPGEQALLTDGAQVRIGLHARFEVAGTVSTQDEATRVVLAQLQQLVQASYRVLDELSARERADFYLAIRDFEVRLQQAASEADLARIAAEGIQHISRTVLGRADLQDLPPLPADLLDPGSPLRLPTIQDVFITDVRRLYDPPGEPRRKTNG